MKFSTSKEFVNATCEAIENTLNCTAAGREMVNELRAKKLAANPSMTEAEWAKVKQEFMLVLFAEFIKNNEQARNDYASLLRKEARARMAA